MHLDQLKLIVYKIILGIERVDYYVSGQITGRDEGLRVREPYVKNIIPAEDLFSS